MSYDPLCCHVLEPRPTPTTPTTPFCILSLLAPTATALDFKVAEKTVAR